MTGDKDADLKAGSGDGNPSGAAVNTALHHAAEYLIASGQAERALTAGRHAPHFKLPNHEGVTMSSVAMLRRGPIVLVFFSGSWCPACSFNLRSLDKARTEIEARGASLVGISAQTVEQNARSRLLTRVTLPILSDQGAKTAGRFGVRWHIPELLRDLHIKGGIDLPKLNGEDNWNLPIPARFVIDESGIIAYSEVDPDYSHEANPQDMLAVLDGLRRTPAA